MINNNTKNKEDQIVIYQTDDGSTVLEVSFTHDTVWLTQAQMVELFGKTKQNISLHINNIFKEGELDKASVVKESLITAVDGKQYKTKLYNLDVIISVGYRIKSQRGTQFRIWATQRLREYLVHDYSINQERFDKNAAELQQALALIRKTAQSSEINAKSGRGLVEIVSRYTQTFLWLQRYDEGLLDEPKGQDGGHLPTPKEAMQALQELKQSLMARGEATELFANLRGGNLSVPNLFFRLIHL
ncbi:virulence RhuM family protein [Candidatus Marithrix sp. Canyon 246]|uniref:virulence RhuM family protein n=1 Tax=Candidatus Marithrix sp. Canyon 246 TaxID=1827136 RepID=UPI00084A174C|nr:RhuM family protein [Candidatus Marithrix sp. Canyon 246]